MSTHVFSLLLLLFVLSVKVSWVCYELSGSISVMHSAVEGLDFIISVLFWVDLVFFALDREFFGGKQCGFGSPGFFDCIHANSR